MKQTAARALPVLAGALSCTILFHWSWSTLSYWKDWGDWYHSSFATIYTACLRLLGFDLADRTTLEWIGIPTAYAIRFLAVILGAAVFHLASGIANLKTLIVTILVALLSSIAYPVLGMIGFPLFATNHPFLGEASVLLLGVAACMYITAPRKFWITAS